MDRYN